jgi:hypothetical protein
MKNIFQIVSEEAFYGNFEEKKSFLSSFITEYCHEDFTSRMKNERKSWDVLQIFYFIKSFVMNFLKFEWNCGRL